MASSALPQQYDQDVSRGPYLLAVFWAETGFVGIVIALRLYVRWVMRNLGADDWSMFAAWLTHTAAVIIGNVQISSGLGRHIYYLSPAQASYVLKLHWIVQPVCIVFLVLGKLSVTLMLLRLVGPNTVWRRWFLWSNLGLYLVISIVVAVLGFVQCSPVEALWTRLPDARCWRPEIQADLVTMLSAYSAFMDFVLALLPITIIWALKMSVQKKIGLYFVLGLGIFSGICASIKASQASQLADRLDVTWELFSLYAWTASESFLLMLCGSVPAIKPLYDLLVSGRPLQNRSSPSARPPYGGGSYSWGNNRSSQRKNNFGPPSEWSVTASGAGLKDGGGSSVGSSVVRMGSINVVHSVDVEPDERV